MKLYVDYSQLTGSDLFTFFYNVYHINAFKMNWHPFSITDNYGVVCDNICFIEFDLIDVINSIHNSGDLIESIWNLIDQDVLVAIKAKTSVEQSFINTQLFRLDNWEPPREKKELRVRIITD